MRLTLQIIFYYYLASTAVFSSKIVDFLPQIQDGEKGKQEDAGKEDQIEDLKCKGGPGKTSHMR